jgi:SAM-dependent methyltransferase
MSQEIPPADRFNTLHSAHYDENWGAVSPSHAGFVARLTGLIRSGGEILDAACGTGKYWPVLLAAGLRVTGVDQSAGMLAQARHKHPEISSLLLGLQEIADTGGLRGRFDGLLCVDALENVAPEDWPGVVTGLAGVLKPRAPAYLTAEAPPDQLPAPADPRQVPGELTGGGGYHYYPPANQVRDWLAAAGFSIEDEQEADSYWHFLLARR